MKEKIIVSDFDGTITVRDTLFTFLSEYADREWTKIEERWTRGEIGSAVCLTEQFNLIPNLTPDLIESFLNSIEIDKYFVDFYENCQKNNIDFLIVSDGLDYFIKKILQKNGLNNIKIISNHAEFINEKFIISFPNKSPECLKKSGTCKCSVIKKLREEYKEIFYIGDGTSDICVANKADYLFAKSTLLDYCKKTDINCIAYKDYSEVFRNDRIGFVI